MCVCVLLSFVFFLSLYALYIYVHRQKYTHSYTHTRKSRTIFFPPLHYIISPSINQLPARYPHSSLLPISLSPSFLNLSSPSHTHTHSHTFTPFLIICKPQPCSQLPFISNRHDQKPILSWLVLQTAIEQHLVAQRDGRVEFFVHDHVSVVREMCVCMIVCVSSE